MIRIKIGSDTVALQLFIGTPSAAQNSILVCHLLSTLLATLGCSHADMVPTEYSVLCLVASRLLS